MKWLIVVAAIMLCSIPVIPVEYQTRHTTLEPYTVTETLRVPYQAAVEVVRWQESEAYQEWKHNFKTSIEDSLPSFYGVGRIPSGQWISDYQYTTKYRDEEVSHTEYEQVVHTEAHTDMVSVIEWLMK